MEEQLAILIIDDDMLDRMAVRRALRSAGVAGDIGEAESSAAAAALLDQREFDCILQMKKWMLPQVICRLPSKHSL